MTKRIFQGCLFLGFCFVLNGCAFQTIQSKQYWYSLQLPKEWKVVSENLFESAHSTPIVLSIIRLRDDSSLEKVILSEKNSLLQEMPDYSSEGEEFLTIHSKRAWKSIGSYKVKGIEKARMRLIVASQQYKFLLTFLVESNQFSKLKKEMETIYKTFSIHIPRY